MKSLLAIGLLASSLLPLTAADPTGDQILRKMSSTLGSARAFSFNATRDVDPSLVAIFEVPEKADVSVVVKRPDKIAVRTTSKSDHRQFLFNGRTLTLFDAKKNFYAVVPMPTTIDGLVAQLDEKYGFLPPLAEFALSDPYQDFRRQAQSITRGADAKIGGGFLGLGGIPCHHLILKGKTADADLWIGVKDHLPRRLLATFHRAKNPKLQIDFQKWNMQAHPTAADFTFTPPKGAQKIEMWTTAKIKAHKH